MADDDQTAVPSELDNQQAAPQQQETVEEPTEPQIDPETGEPIVTEADDFEDVEVDGQTYKVPKALTAHIMRDKDYTEKSQLNAKDRKALEAREAEIEERRKVTDDELDTRADLRTVTKELERFAKFDFAAYQQARQTDPMGADEAWAYAQHLKNQKAELEGKIGNVDKQRTDKASQDLDKRIQDTLAAAPKVIPGWKAETANETISSLVAFADSVGIPEQALKANWSPELLKLLHLGRIGHLATQKQAAPKPKAGEPAQPLKTVTPKSNPAPAGLSDKLPVDEWADRFRKKHFGARA